MIASDDVDPLLATSPVAAPEKGAAVTARANKLGDLLRSTLTPLVQSCVGASMRPATLARALEVDRTLAARLLRALRAEDTAHMLHEIPAPGGLRILIDAAAAHKAPATLCKPAYIAVREFELLIDEFPGGRGALDAALGGINEAVRVRSARAAAQAVHRSMTSLLGYQAEVMISTVIVQPSADGRNVDTAYILGKCGVRRLRASSPITIFGWRGEASEPLPERRRIETIDGQVQPELGTAYLLKDYCTRPTPPLSLYQSDDLYLYTLAESIPRVNEPVTLIGAQVVRNNGPRYQTDLSRFYWESHTPRFPCRVLLADIYVRDDVFVDHPPTVTTTLHSIATGAPRPDAPAFQLDDVGVEAPLQSLGSGTNRSASRDVPQYTSMLRTVFDGLGWNPERFRGYRCRLQYPIPLVSLTFWFDLLTNPGQTQR